MLVPVLGNAGTDDAHNQPRATACIHANRTYTVIVPGFASTVTSLDGLACAITLWKPDWTRANSALSELAAFTPRFLHSRELPARLVLAGWCHLDVHGSNGRGNHEGVAWLIN